MKGFQVLFQEMNDLSYLLKKLLFQRKNLLCMPKREKPNFYSYYLKWNKKIYIYTENQKSSCRTANINERSTQRPEEFFHTL